MAAQSNETFRSIEPKILYFGTPVALISSLNPDGSTNLAPISSFWALGWTMMLGLLDDTQTVENLGRHGECVVNVPAPELWRHVEKLAPLTGRDPVPAIKQKQFDYEKDKFRAAELTAMASELVQPDRVAECAFQLEAKVSGLHAMRGARLEQLGGGHAAEVEILRVHALPDYVDDDDHVDTSKWSPLLYNFRHYFQLANEELGKTFRA